MSKKASLLSIHAGFQARTFPAPMPRQYLYLALTDGHGPTPLTVRLVGGDDAALFSFELPPVRFGSPLDVKELAVEAPAVTIPAPGLYRWQVVCARGDSRAETSRGVGQRVPRRLQGGALE